MARQESSPRDGKTDGANVAAYLAAAVAVFLLGLVQTGYELYPEFQPTVKKAGTAWLPDDAAKSIGPYSGKETITVVGWVLSWAILHLSLRGRRFDVRSSFAAAMTLLAVGVILLWPPVWHFLEKAVHG